MLKEYENQVALVVRCLPIIESENCFALKGGTAINLFYSDLPRLSVDIDLTYIEIDSRKVAISNINQALHRIIEKLKKIDIKAIAQKDSAGYLKLICSDADTTIKIEPNYIIRGSLCPPIRMVVSDKVHNKFGFASMNIISKQEVWGGKICAALDRQHPRDLFDIHNLLSTEGITEEIKKGFLFMAVQHNRNLYELLNPSKLDASKLFNTEFLGMCDKEFTLEDHYKTLSNLLDSLKSSLTEQDKKALLDFVQLISNDESPFPAIQWKIKNLEKLRDTNPEKFKEQYEKLKAIL